MILLRLKLTAGLIALGLAVSAMPAAAHHSFAMFDVSKNVTVTGTVKELQWTNPHVILFVYADPQPDQQPELWTIELTSPGNLTRLGWSRHSLKTADRVSVEINPLRDGTHGGSLEKATLLDTGEVFTSNFKDQEKPDLP